MVSSVASYTSLGLFEQLVGALFNYLLPHLFILFSARNSSKCCVAVCTYGNRLENTLDIVVGKQITDTVEHCRGVWKENRATVSFPKARANVSVTYNAQQRAVEVMDIGGCIAWSIGEPLGRLEGGVAEETVNKSMPPDGAYAPLGN